MKVIFDSKSGFLTIEARKGSRKEKTIVQEIRQKLFAGPEKLYFVGSDNTEVPTGHPDKQSFTSKINKIILRLAE